MFSFFSVILLVWDLWVVCLLMCYEGCTVQSEQVDEICCFLWGIVIAERPLLNGYINAQDSGSGADENALVKAALGMLT